MMKQTPLRNRFYKPIREHGQERWKYYKQGLVHRGFETYSYQRKTREDLPLKENSLNTYFGKRTMWNPIPGKIGVVNKKAADWGYPHREPPPAGLRQSQEYFPFFFNRYFPETECKLMVDSVLNNETHAPMFAFPPDVSREEITNYLRNIYGIDSIVGIGVRNVAGRRFKNEVGKIKMLPEQKIATVILDTPVIVDFKQIKGTDDTADAQAAKAKN